MPGLDGFGVLEALDFEPLPQIVFVTAHDHFALRAFEVHALDYLLKPFDPGRFEKVLDRAKAFIKRGADESESVSKLLEELRGRPRYIERLLIHCEDRAFFLRVDQIQWIESAKNYVRLHVDKNVYSIRGTIERIEQTARSRAVFANQSLADCKSRQHQRATALVSWRVSHHLERRHRK